MGIEVAKRVNMALRPGAVEALDEVASEEGVTDTEAMHLLIKWGRFLRNASRTEGQRVLIERDGQLTEVVFL